MKNTDLFKELYGSNAWKDIKEQFNKDFKACRSRNDVVKVSNKYVPYMFTRDSLNTITSKITEIRNEIKSLNSKFSDYALEVAFSFGDENTEKGIYGVKAKRSRKKLIEKHKGERKEITLKAVKKLVKTLKERIDSNDFKDITHKAQTEEQVKAYHLAIVLGLATGRRQVELLKTFSLSTRKGQPYFKGIVKKGSSDTEEYEGSIIFISPQDAKKYLNELRKILNVSVLDNKTINQKYNAMFNKALVKYSSEIIGIDLKFHDLRKIYAESAFSLSGTNMDRDLFFKDVLKQKVEPTTATNYMDFSIK
ncbi:MAG TPA: hypothetical protein EYG73_02530 [Arcobacter sp.]|nr:hypothetical protein [Arcobacter sp.]